MARVKGVSIKLLLPAAATEDEAKTMIEKWNTETDKLRMAMRDVYPSVGFSTSTIMNDA